MEPEEGHTACSHRMRNYNVCHISDVAKAVDSNVPVADDGNGLIDHRSATRRRWGMKGKEHVCVYVADA